jgi:phenylacetate-CoA ligase
MIVKVERAPEITPEKDPLLKETIAQAIRRHLLVRADVEILDYGTLPRTDRKSKRVFDHRNLNGS